MRKDQYDVLIIGAGVTGCAIARELSHTGLKVALAEACDDVAMGSSRANSAIVHAGYDCVPGTLMALAAWMGLSFLYSLYVENFADYSVLYGSIGTIIVVLIWLYMSAIVLIMGAELNGTLMSLRKERMK